MGESVWPKRRLALEAMPVSYGRTYEYTIGSNDRHMYDVRIVVRREVGRYIGRNRGESAIHTYPYFSMARSGRLK